MLLYINGCTRKSSRTKLLADTLINKLGETVNEIKLYEEGFSVLSEEKLNIRENLIQKKDFDNEIFRYARQFAEADTIIIAVPFWDLSFPAALKLYIENIYITGIVSKYNENGKPEGLCKAKKLYYVTTAGGPYNPDFSFEYIKTLAVNFFGIPSVELIYADNLDIIGNNADEIMKSTIDNINNLY